MRDTRAELVRHVGGRPTAVQQALIERAAQLSLRIAAMDRRFAELGEQTDHDSRTYLAWSNSLTRTLAQLGLQGVVEKPPSLASYLTAAPSRARTAPADLAGDEAPEPPEPASNALGTAA